MRLENEVRFGFLTFDWKSAPSVDALNDRLQHVGRMARVCDLSHESGGDGGFWVIHSGEFSFRAHQWYDLYQLTEGALDEDDPRTEKFANSLSHPYGNSYAMTREDIEEFMGSTEPKTIKITDPDIARRGKPFTVDSDGNKVYL